MIFVQAFVPVAGSPSASLRAIWDRLHSDATMWVIPPPVDDGSDLLPLLLSRGTREIRLVSRALMAWKLVLSDRGPAVTSRAQLFHIRRAASRGGEFRWARSARSKPMAIGWRCFGPTSAFHPFLPGGQLLANKDLLASRCNGATEKRAIDRGTDPPARLFPANCPSSSSEHHCYNLAFGARGVVEGDLGHFLKVRAMAVTC